MGASRSNPCCSSTSLRGQEVTWEALVQFFEQFGHINPEWQSRKKQVHLYYILKIYFHNGQLAGDFVHSRYIDPGRRLWFCRSLDPSLVEEACSCSFFG